MVWKNLKKILTFNGIAFAIGILGSIASIMTVFVTNWNSLVNVKWLILIFFLTFSIILILVKLVYNFNEQLKKKNLLSFKVLRYIPQSMTFIININDSLCYSPFLRPQKVIS